MSLQFQNIPCCPQHWLETSLSWFGIAHLDFAEKFKNLYREIPANRNQKPILKNLKHL